MRGKNLAVNSQNAQPGAEICGKRIHEQLH